VRFGLSVASQNRRMEVSARHALRCSGLLRVKASLTRVSQSVMKSGTDVMTGGACGTIVNVVSKIN
jgi:hypothetical protein